MGGTFCADPLLTQVVILGTFKMMLSKIIFNTNSFFLLGFILCSACNQQNFVEESILEIGHSPTQAPTIMLMLTQQPSPTEITEQLEPSQASLPTPIPLQPTQTPIPTLPFIDLDKAEEILLIEGGYGFYSENLTGALDTSGVKTFFFYGNESSMHLYSESGNDLSFLFEKKDGSQPIQSVSTAERHYLDTSSRGRGFGYVGLDEYLIYVIGSPATTYDFRLTFGYTFHPDLGDPQRIEIPDGEQFITIRSTSKSPILDRYMFTAFAGQTVEILDIDSFLVVVWLEDKDQNIILRADQNNENKIVLPADGEYILTVFHNGGEVYAYGDYEFVLVIKN